MTVLVVAVISGCGGSSTLDTGQAETYVKAKVRSDVMHYGPTRQAALGPSGDGKPDLQVLCGNAKHPGTLTYDCDATFYATFNSAEAGKESWRLSLAKDGSVVTARRVASNIR